MQSLLGLRIQDHVDIFWPKQLKMGNNTSWHRFFYFVEDYAK